MATDPLALAQAVKEYQAAKAAGSSSLPCPSLAGSGLVEGLIKEFGLGINPGPRRTLYERLARLEREHGQAAELLIAEARSLARAPTVRNKGNYFARAVTLKLREAGIV